MANTTRRLSVRLTDKEQVWALIYLLFSYLMLPTLIYELVEFLPVQLADHWINFLYFAVNFTMVLWIFGGFFRRSLAYAGQNVLDFLMAVILGFGFYWLCSWGISMVYGWLFPDFLNLNDGSIASMAQGNFALVFVGTVFLVPVAEEALHRGLVFGSLYHKSAMAAYLLSTVIFASVHLMGYVGVYSNLHLALAFIQYVPAGLTLAWAYRRSGSIFAPMVMHAVINALGMFAQR